MNDVRFSVQGKSVLVTGAGTGIGRAIALGLAAAGARVTIGEINDARRAEVVDEAGRQGLSLIGFRCDVSQEDEVTALVEQHLKHWGAWDIAFANAGIAGALVPTVEMSLADLHRVLGVNVDGAFLVARAAMQVMLPQRAGSIVLTSSVWGERGFEAPVTAYAASKGAVSNLVRQFAVEAAPAGVRVNGLLPAGVRTNIADNFYDDDDAVSALASRIPFKRIVGPEEVVGPAIFLASDASSWVTGHLLAVDGGYLAH